MSDVRYPLFLCSTALCNQVKLVTVRLFLLPQIHPATTGNGSFEIHPLMEDRQQLLAIKNAARHENLIFKGSEIPICLHPFLLQKSIKTWCDFKN